MATASQIQSKSASEIRNFAVSFAGKLDSGELLSGTPTIAEVTTTDLTIENKVVSTTSLTINGESVAASHAVQFKVAGGTAGARYTIKITVVTNASPVQTLIENVVFDCVAD